MHKQRALDCSTLHPKVSYEHVNVHQPFAPVSSRTKFLDSHYTYCITISTIVNDVAIPLPRLLAIWRLLSYYIPKDMLWKKASTNSDCDSVPLSLRSI